MKNQCSCSQVFPDAFPSWFDFFDNVKPVQVTVQVTNKFHLVVVLSICFEMRVKGQREGSHFLLNLMTLDWSLRTHVVQGENWFLKVVF